jgi:zinc transport system substrate-binding protein
MRHRFLTLFVFALLAGPARAAAPDVLVTIKPVHSLVAAVMEGVGTPHLLIRAAASQHTYVLKPSDARKISRAGIVFWIGPDLETFLTTPLANLASGAEIVALEHAHGVHLLAARPGGLSHAPPTAAKAGNINPHIWLDPDNAIAMTRAIAAVLAKADPGHAARYRANAAAEVARLSALDKQLARELKPIRHRPYIVYHDAYPYLEARYGLNAIGAVTVEPDRPVGPRRIVRLRAAIKAGKAVCLFREPQFPPALIETLARDTDVRVGVLDPLGADLKPGPDLYPEMMHGLAQALTGCLAPRH